MAALKTDFEKQCGIKFSKNGIINYVENILQKESKDDTQNGKLWEEKLQTPNIKLFIKKNGSEMNAKQPYLRIESRYKNAYKMEKIL